MKIGKMRFVPVRNAPGVYDIFFSLVSDQNPGYKAFSCEYNNFRLCHASDYNALRMMVTAYQRISERPIKIYEIAPAAHIPGANKSNIFASLPTLDYFIGYH